MKATVKTISGNTVASFGFTDRADFINQAASLIDSGVVKENYELSADGKHWKAVKRHGTLVLVSKASKIASQPKRLNLNFSRDSSWADFTFLFSIICLVVGAFVVIYGFGENETQPIITGIFFLAVAGHGFFVGWLVNLLSNLRWLSAQQLDYQIKTFELLNEQNQKYEEQLREHESSNDA